MAESLYFNQHQRGWVAEALEKAEALVGEYFRLDVADPDRFPYDLRTLAALRVREKTRRALAQVCKYEIRRDRERFQSRSREFYRICLQDDKILTAIGSEAPETLKPLLLYVLTHEIIHVTRFTLDPGRFYLDARGKGVEEKYVHRKTYEILTSSGDASVEPLLERYRPWWEEGGPAAWSPALDNAGTRV